MEWKHPGLSRKNNFKGRYLLANYFCDCSAVLLVDIIEYESQANTDEYCATLKTLLEAIRRNVPVFLAMV
jgi:hypothetical protein